jgi:hypothetical protein
MPAGELVLVLPFRLHGHDGRVRVWYGTNDDPVAIGHDLVAVGYDEKTFRGFPVIEAVVETDAMGYRAWCGWIQLITRTDIAEGSTSVEVDLLPVVGDLDSPMCYVGHRPTLFDAPANPEHPDGQWLAESFLVSVDVRGQAVAPLAGVAWGYDLTGGRPSVLPVRPVDPDRWEDHRPVLADGFPRWTFESG